MINEETKASVKRIEESLRKLGFDDKEIAYWLLRFDLAIREAMGKRILARLPLEKQKEAEKLVRENKDVADLWASIKNYLTLEEVKAIYQEKLSQIEQELVSWTEEVGGVFDEAKERIKKEILPRLST